MRTLLAAEADKIQDFIFRSSRLREVAGASQILTRFCRAPDGVPRLVQEYGGDVLVNDGGSFRIVFDGVAEDRVQAFGLALAELYRLAVDGSLTVARPVQVNGDFQTANREAGRALRQAKNGRGGALAEPHLSYVAFCASCGVGLADRHAALAGGAQPGRADYLCPTCQAKAAERGRRAGELLGDFFSAYGHGVDEGDERWPEADDIGRLDPARHQYVAYLVADGNGMGDLFGRCDEAAIRVLSEGLMPAVRGALAEAGGQVHLRVPGQANMARVLPLILGGDDLFALIPVAYSLDFARCFCQAYERNLAVLVQQAGIADAPRPTIAAAVVICKSKYPYALAHARAERLLAAAKRRCKQLVQAGGERLSAVNFDIVVGNHLAMAEDEPADIRPTLRPYWVRPVGEAALSDRAGRYGRPLDNLLETRLALKDVPSSRLAQLRTHWARLPQDADRRNRDERLKQWTAGLNRTIGRAGAAQRELLRTAMGTLGRPAEPGDPDGSGHHWLAVLPSAGKDTVLAHGMLDLIRVWDYAQALDHKLEEYEPEEER